MIVQGSKESIAGMVYAYVGPTGSRSKVTASKLGDIVDRSLSEVGPHIEASYSFGNNPRAFKCRELGSMP